MFKRVLMIILDSVGIGALPDAQKFGDALTVNTLKNTAKAIGTLNLPHLASLGLGSLDSIKGLANKAPKSGLAIKLAELSQGKDTLTGHWELAGLALKKGFAYFPQGFPDEIIQRLVSDNNLPGVLHNEAASGTQVLVEYGEEHMRTGKPIVYTSADSVLQIACHEDLFGLERLYEICANARLLCDEYNIARVIARPFVGDSPQDFKRTHNRKDFSIALPGKVVFDYLEAEGVATHTVGKVSNIYNHQGIATNVKSKNNQDGMDKFLLLMDGFKDGLLMINLVDFDQDFGHRRDVKGYGKALEEFDKRLPQVLGKMSDDDLLVITADHGNDPTAPGTDHTREYVPLLIHSPRVLASRKAPDAKNFLTVGATIFAALTDKELGIGKSLLPYLKLAPLEDSSRFSAPAIIAKKRDGELLTKKEISWFIDAFGDGRVADYQLSALLMAIYLNGMDTVETAALTDAILYSGSVISMFDPTCIDKHSTGGVGDKTSFIVAPIAAAAGVKVPMVSGRGLGHTGGTIDKIESLPGFRTSLTMNQFREQLQEIGLVLIGQTADIAPADKRIYALRDVTATVSSIPLITASIMAKKLAEGAQGFVFDVKTGSGAFMKRKSAALALAKSLIHTAKRFQKSCLALVTDMNQPLGFAIGNSLEIRESIATLKGEGPRDLTALCHELAGAMIWLAGLEKSHASGVKRSKELIRNGKALEKFRELVKAQGGDERAVDDLALLAVASTTSEFLAPHSGYLSKIATERLGMMCAELGGGRLAAGDDVDTSVGFILHKKLGDKIRQGETVLTVFHHESQRDLVIKLTSELAATVIKIAPQKPIVPPLILQKLS